MPDTATRHPDYEALGIFPDTWACVNISPDKRTAMKGVFDLALSGVPTKVAKDPDGKRYHIAVQGGLAGCPVAWIVALRGEAYEPITCSPETTGQHPQAVRDGS